MSERTARNLMSTAELVNQIGKNCRFAVTTIYNVAAPSTPETVRDEIVDCLERGDIMSSQAIATAIADGKKHEPRCDDAKAKVDRKLQG